MCVCVCVLMKRQPNSVYNEYGVDMIGAMQPVNTYVYEPNWAPNAQ